MSEQAEGISANRDAHSAARTVPAAPAVPVRPVRTVPAGQQRVKSTTSINSALSSAVSKVTSNDIDGAAAEMQERCAACKEAHRSKVQCRVTLGHDAAPWKALDRDNQAPPQEHESVTMKERCLECKEAHRSKLQCRVAHGHTAPAWRDAMFEEHADALGSGCAAHSAVNGKRPIPAEPETSADEACVEAPLIGCNGEISGSFVISNHTVATATCNSTVGLLETHGDYLKRLKELIE